MYCVYIQIVDICLCIYVKKRAAGDILFFAACCLHVHFVGQPFVAGFVIENTIPLMNKSCGWNSLDGNKTLVNAILDGPISSYEFLRCKKISNIAAFFFKSIGYSGIQ